MQISVIVTTYNRPKALNCVLASLAMQSVLPLEIIIADDGSTAETKELIESWQAKMSCQLLHIWQDDQGFRAASARNKGVAASRGEYLVFLDGDCIVFTDFIARHITLAEHGQMVIGSRLLCSPILTDQIEQFQAFPIAWGLGDWVKARWQNKVNRIFPLIRLPNMALRKCRGLKWRGVRTFNLAVWRQDFCAVNGFDELFQGWGHEDADLAVRLIHAGVKRKDGQFALPVLHLWHHESNRQQETKNMQRLQNRINSRQILADIGLNQYADSTLKCNVL